MQTFLVNLKRRPDRLAAMTAQLDRLGIAFERFDAVDAKAVDPAELSVPFAAGGPLGTLSPGDKACTYSHLHLWRRIAAGQDEYAVILEDDILLSDAAPLFLIDSAWIPRSIGLVKLERYGPPSQHIIIGRRSIPVHGRTLAPLLSRHTGSGGYIISRENAARLATMTGKIAVSIDHLLFNPNNSPMFPVLKPWQLIPAILDQRVDIGGATDIHATRDDIRPRGWAGISRRLARNYYDLRLLPKQLTAMLLGQAKFMKIEYA
ncbi:MAG TPA: glycosyltransferase family 25 protein [Rhizomicrobium sp.]|jgi:glycosyl transferase family 25